MVNGINPSGDGKEWKKLDATTTNSDYRKVLDSQIDSILKGKDTISAAELKKNSVFKNLSGAALQRFETIAGLDGDIKSFSADELRVLYALADAELKNDSFVFDGKFAVDINRGGGGLEQVTDDEFDAVVKNLSKTDVRKKIQELDSGKYDRSKDFKEKIQSEDVDEVMLAVSDKLQSGYTDKRTGDSVSIPQAVLMFEEFVESSYRKEYQNFYEDVAKDFTEQTGIPVSDFSRLRCIGDGDSFTIGDWQYKRGTITNTKTGETVQGERLRWRNSAENTVPAQNGRFFMIKEYSDGKGTAIDFKYDDGENIAPTRANVTTDGEAKMVSYSSKDFVDASVYNFRW